MHRSPRSYSTRLLTSASESKRANIALIGLSLVGLAACSDDVDYGVVVKFAPEALADRITHVDVSLVSTCFEEKALGQEPFDPIARVELDRTAPVGDMGDIDDGAYALYARGIGPCVGAAGCVDIEVAREGNRVFEVTLHEVEASKYSATLPKNGGCLGASTCGETDTGEAVCNCPDNLRYIDGECVPEEGANEDYVSDWVWLYESNGTSNVERDKSINTPLHGDGNPIRIRGTTYMKGIGAHAPGEIHLNLDARCRRFRATVGIDDEAVGAGEARAEVWSDDGLIFQSGTLTGTSAPERIDVDITGKYQLRLVLRDLGDMAGDHVDWANARVVCDDDWHGDAVTSYVSDWSWDDSTNETGPVERDQSNGDEDEGDGETITINDETYGKGIGVHAPSEVELDLAGHCRRFRADVGIDDAVASGGSAVFQVFGDEEMLFESGTITAAMNAHPVNVDLVGISKLRLVVTDAGDGTVGDLGDWANAQLLCRSGWEGRTVDTYLSDWVFAFSTNTFGPVERDTTNGDMRGHDGGSLRLDGREYARGMGVHADSQIWIRTNGLCTRFRADVGIDDDASVGGEGAGSVTFRVAEQGETIFASPVKHYGDAPTSIDVDITGRTLLELNAESGGDNAAWDHADWADARLRCAPGALGL